MPEKAMITFKNIMMEGAADDGTLSFNYWSSGDAVIEIDIDTLDALIDIFEQEAAA